MVGPRDELNWLSCTFVWCVSGLFKVIFCSFLFPPPLSPPSSTIVQHMIVYCLSTYRQGRKTKKIKR
ncbi:uncharacterized protein BO87DRAFT_167956 [Aspergillus neoniger CBS 115656]|uniref:Uncharacterized protein n=1 Tax=Aspergillus neoniger (strain CBS 115656) TaxID=1448310 RepID=A0A318Z3Z9_ASPNB|nr:hypothetical protein BO87DRAFT_167956 [Aspergillus neoniger CBS 115656]PYH38440.1 hypothetical protein BO87DRAFT_167956 [Aspergillus neoniger CBS 115656]